MLTEYLSAALAKAHYEVLGDGEGSLTIPNPQGSDVDPELLNQVLRQAGISREEWERL